MRARTINEELIGKFHTEFGRGVIEMYKNPPSVHRMGPWLRGITNYNGDFYIACTENETQSTMSTTHTKMVDWLRKKGENIKLRWDGNNGYVDGIAWQRYENTNKFYLSESYESITDEFKKSLDLDNIFKPSGVKWVLEVISDISFEAPNFMDDYRNEEEKNMY